MGDDLYARDDRRLVSRQILGTQSMMKNFLRSARELTIRVDKWEDVEVVLVEDLGDSHVFVKVAIDELKRDILKNLNFSVGADQYLLRGTYRSDNPFSSMYSAVVENGRFARTIIAVQVQAVDVPSLMRLSRRDQLRVIRE